jgi:hypothetical protein
MKDKNNTKNGGELIKILSTLDPHCLDPNLNLYRLGLGLRLGLRKRYTVVPQKTETENLR